RTGRSTGPAAPAAASSPRRWESSSAEGTMLRTVIPLAALLCLPPAARAADPVQVRRAVERSLPLLQAGARTFRERSEGRCIGCHHQGPLQLVVALARERGFRVDEESERAELDRIR